MPQPYAHIQIGARDVLRLVAFYDQVLAVLGWVRGVEPARAGDAGVFWRQPGTRWPQFVVREPFDGRTATVGNGTQVSFLAESPQLVEKAWRSALEAGGTDEGRPGLRPRYAPDFFAAYCRDPEGHKLCFVCTGSRVDGPAAD
jgi:catechol 2,3-dioxygenase-like lactoylglutathione lyase family enzyme